MTDNGGGELLPMPPPPTQIRRRRARVRGAAMLLGVLVLLASACSDEAEPEPVGRVAVVGDSTTDVAIPALNEAVDGTIDVRAVWGVLVQNMQGQATELAQQPTDHLVINLGTNDSLRGLDPAVAAGGIASMADGFTITTGCVHLVTISEHMQSQGGHDAATVAAGINAQLRALAEAQGYLIVDWNAIVEERLAAGEMATDDTIHPTAEGAVLMADAIATSLADC
jgi:lysophospholipase L1-like esterase